MLDAILMLFITSLSCAVIIGDPSIDRETLVYRAQYKLAKRHYYVADMFNEVSTPKL